MIFRVPEAKFLSLLRIVCFGKVYIPYLSKADGVIDLLLGLYADQGSSHVPSLNVSCTLHASASLDKKYFFIADCYRPC